MLFVGQSVTCLGNVSGTVTAIRTQDGVITMAVITASNWLLANNKPPIFYMNPASVVPLFKCGDMISCTFGKGEIKEIRNDGVFVVTLANWFLADGKSPILYLQESALSKYTSGKEVVPDLVDSKTYVEECITKATLYKNEATDFYKAGDYASARGKYLEALGAMHYLHSDLSNAEKANVFEMSVPCHNNIALCCMNMEKFAECIAFSKNGLLLITSLESKINSGPSEVWKCLEANGLTLEKLVEWKRKSLFYMGKAELKNKDFDDAVTHLESALALTPPKAKDAAVLKDLLETAKKYRAAELKKEKNTWSKAFKSSKAEQEAEEAATKAATASASSPATKQQRPNGHAAPADDASSKATVSKTGDKIHIDMNSILGKASKADGTVAKRDDTFFNMMFGLGFLGVVGGFLWAYRLRFWRR